MRSLPVRVLIGSGAFCLAAAGLTSVWAAPALLKAPLVNSTETRATGPALRLNSSSGEQVEGEFRQFRAVGTAQADGEALGGGDVAVYESYTENEWESSVTGEDVDLTKTLYTQAFDRASGEGVPGYEGDTLGTEAHVFKLPFGVEKTDYTLWDSTTSQALPLEYVGEAEVEGLAVYEFRQVVPPTDLGELPVVKAIPGALVGEPGTPSIPANQWAEGSKTVYVEPVTGSLVGGSTSQRTWAQTADGRTVDLLTIDGATPTPESLSALVASAEESKGKAQLLNTAPWVLGGLGVVLLAAGGLGARRRPGRTASAHAAPGVVDLDKHLPNPRDESPLHEHLR